MSSRSGSASARIGWLPFTDNRRVASVRLRSIRPVDYLRSAGAAAELFDPARRYDVVVLQKAYEPPHLRLAAELRAAGTKLVLDLCDNHLFNPSGSPALAARAERLREMVTLSDVVTVGTAKLGELLGLADALVVDDALELPTPGTWALGRLGRAVPGRPGRSRLLWFGSAGSHDLPFGMRDIAGLVDVLGAVHQTSPISLTVLSNSRSAYREAFGRAGFPVHYLRWRPGVFELFAGRSDIALLPVARNPYTDGKTTNRLATALTRGLACVASPLPSYVERYAGAVLFEDWASSIKRYAGDPAVRARDAAEGARRAYEQYAPDRVRAQWQTAIDAALRD